MNAIVRIGSVKLENPVFTAPMAGYTDKAFRYLAKEAGVALTYTEMVSGKGLIYKNKATWELINLDGESGKVAIQLFGREPEIMGEATYMAVESGAHIVDLNMGCPTPKIVKNGEGAALMKDIKQAEAVVRAMVRAAETVPVTVKMRLGWDEDSINVVEVAKAVEGAGAAAVAVHGRTRNQFYSGEANWDYIKKVKESINIPVIGNGDITSPIDALAMIEQTHCDAVMIGRGAIGNPWLLKATCVVVEGGDIPPLPDVSTRLSMACRHLDLLVDLKGEVQAVKEIRKHLIHYIKGLRGAAKLRQVLNKLTTASEVKKTLNNFGCNYNSH
ncbi:MAG: tRNA-dihydrouridine synthase [Clostridia bacterium]|nr:tRNA-dihydrouridine synthase [Clostridia bacterium]